MIDPAKADLIAALHASPWQGVLALTGGGTQAAADLLNVPGGSRTILEVIVPYGEAALAAFLGQQPRQYCSAETCQAMAARAWQRAAWLRPRQPVSGVAVAASLATDRPKQGTHRFHIALQDRLRLAIVSLTLIKGSRSRVEEEALLDAFLLNALAEFANLPHRLPLDLRPEELVQSMTRSIAGLLPGLLAGQHSCVCVAADGQWSAAADKPRVLLPGSFNPLHQGHVRLAETAGQLLQAPVHFEISVVNVDKPPLTAEEIDVRLGQFAWQAPVWLTRAPTFAEKCLLFPGAVFVVGMDTAIRILDPKYHGQDEAALRQALRLIGDQGCRFVVAGRLLDQRFQGLESLAVPAEFADLFRAIPENQYRWDLSSTQLRQQAAGPGSRGESGPGLA